MMAIVVMHTSVKLNENMFKELKLGQARSITLLADGTVVC